MGADAMHAAATPAAPSAAPAASPWPVFWVASIAVFLVSLDSTMLYAAFGALREGFPEASAAVCPGCSTPIRSCSPPC
ncbi:hypothetical protein AVE30378_05352 [Achromobacter veterisilvae]|uniref:Uncharacterized protein n=1 Tax=Achromobacter veterisilvae TaxID=2069367 RepID=A0A446CYA2_9BURK|nr:hypothetical protein AVE30378_05352 [Achromobacter veterisilvae]